MSTTQAIELYKILSRHFKNEEEATLIVRDIEQIIADKFDERKDVLSTKEDLANAKADIIKWMFIFWIGQMAATVTIVKLLGV